MDTTRKRKFVILLFIIISVVAVTSAWYKYSSNPWTRHGEVQADIIKDEASLRISAMYRENQLAKIAVGETARVVLMSAKKKKLSGKVRSLGTAIALPETASANNLVPSIPAILTGYACPSGFLLLSLWIRARPQATSSRA